MNDVSPVEAIFFAALEKGSPQERAAFLDEATAGNPDLRRRLEKMLTAQAEAGSFLEQPARAPAMTLDEPLAETLGTVIGPYKLLEQIGEGGFGLVFMAEQQQPLRRKVALKVLKPGMDSRQVIARFEAERQALALMDHPHIAKVLDAGQTGSGRPYFIMDLVKGLPITAYCDQSQCTPRERLELFMHVCQAVQHAHQKGIIHRDLKPSNVLVTLHDGTPLVKVIDFGIAKALGQQLTEKTLFTGFGQMLGTPLYMSPEQAALSDMDVDTRSDIYSLGVLLYELLTGTTPFDKERFSQVGYDEMRRIIREEEPPRPSTRISTLGQAATTVSTNRKSDPKQLSRLFRGELDWIVMKALEKDRNRRYETAGALAADVQRYLHDEPVQACPPSAWYRYAKLARRNKATLSIAGLVLLVLFSVVGGIGWLAGEQGARRTSAMEALQETTRLVEDGKWSEARTALQRAETLLETAGGTAALGKQVEDLKDDLAMVRQLADNGLEGGQGKATEHRPDKEQRTEAYAQAFRAYGIDVEALDASDAAERIRSRLIRVELAAGLDRWAELRRRSPEGPGKSWKDLVAVARAADDDPWRQLVRQAWGQEDRRALVAIAGKEWGKLPPPTLALLTLALTATDGSDQAWALIRLAHRRYPGDFWINQRLIAGLNSVAIADPEQQMKLYQLAVANPYVAKLTGPSKQVTAGTGDLLGEIWSGEALNRLLMKTYKLQKQGKQLPVAMDQSVLQRINVTRGGGSIALLKKGRGRLNWPSALQAPECAQERNSLTTLALEVYAQAFSKAGVETLKVKQMRVDASGLAKRLREMVGDLPPAQWLEAHRFLRHLDDTLNALEQPDVHRYLTGEYAPKGKTIPEVVDSMVKQGLLFAPAVRGDEQDYQAMYQRLADYLAALGEGQAKP
jgi:serine/threonine protein kinase